MGIPRFFGPYIGENQPGRVFNPGMAPRPGSVHQQRSRSRVELLESLVYHCHHTKYGYCLFRARFQELSSHSDGKLVAVVCTTTETMSPCRRTQAKEFTRIDVWTYTTNGISSPTASYVHKQPHLLAHRINVRTFTNMGIYSSTVTTCGRT